MRTTLALVALTLLSGAARGDILWNNFQGPNGFDNRDSLSSERQTIVTESWTVDDAIFDAEAFPMGVRIQGIRWIGARSVGAPFPAADYIILDSNFNPVPIADALRLDQPYTIEQELTSTFPPDLQAYQGIVAVQDIELAPGHYYFGTRLKGQFQGRSFIATTGNLNILGLTQGYFQSLFFGFPNYVPAEQAFAGGASDFAFQIVGEPIVPEPTSVVLALAGVLLGLRRAASSGRERSRDVIE